ncbi:hypothetical protein TrCOL_g1130 [Triparma columacea]|uniref:Mif2/CENP-C cupin domain-containing protein n=1 Tax=Triparma columacea TaxID=722753 RepID=A0A9W7G964_9STRA|nr:hypothetical protein TrCOL_g1130 [Triparma columacea]
MSSSRFATVSERMRGRRTGIAVRETTRGADGLEDPDAFFEAETVGTSRASIQTPQSKKGKRSAASPNSPAISTPGFSFGSGDDGSLAKTPGSGRKSRKSIAQLSVVQTPESASAGSGFDAISDVSTTVPKRGRNVYPSSPDSLSGFSAGRDEESSISIAPDTPDEVRKARAKAAKNKEDDRKKKAAAKRQREMKKAEKKANRKATYAEYEDDDEILPDTKEGGQLKFTSFVTDGEDSPEPESDGVRRSKRMRFAPLKFWKNERIVVKPDINMDGDDALEYNDESVPVMTKVVGVLHAVESPKKKKGLARNPLGLKGRRPVKFDAEKLPEGVIYSDADKAVVWDEGEGEYRNTKIISYCSDMNATALPITADREPEKDVVGLAAQAFNINQATEDVPGWISGHVILPPEGIKDAEGVGMCSQVFFVSDCQPKAFEVAIGAPEETTFNPETAQRFLLSAGDFFHVPPNNIYRVENHSDTTECKLFWAIIRPMAKDEE